MKNLLALSLLPLTHADLYMHNPRGSNNKLNEVSNNAQNQNRLFDSQNNAAGGYQVGDDCEPVCSNANNNYDKTSPGAGKGQMYYYEGSRLTIEWTNQHGCGSAQQNVKCNLVLQYMCEDSSPGLRDGTTTNRVPDNEAGYADPQYGVHEPLSWYESCKARGRNTGLYIADQNLRGNRQYAINTRQNPNGNRRGLECPEERDYYPYWHPTPWRDIAVFTDDVGLCGYYEWESQNVRDKGMCCNATSYAMDGTCVQQPGRIENNQVIPGPNSHAACIADQQNAGVWVEYGAWNTWPPLCERSPYARDNHLGNSVPTQAESGGYFATNRAPSFEWEVPWDILHGKDVDEMTCVLRMRYNISTMDYDGWGIHTGTMVDSKLNGADASPQNNPKGDFLGLRPAEGIGTDYPLQLNINTNQYGRTFEDRSHTFKVKRRPPVFTKCHNSRIHNLNVRGRRGNIVQVYPSVEYDFVPVHLEVNEGDCIHFQWAGSDANPAGNAGNGRRMTDRTNIVELPALSKNIPAKHGYDRLPWAFGEHYYYSMFPDEATVKRFAYLGQEVYYNATTGSVVPSGACDDESQDEQALNNCKHLNAASGYFDGGLVQMGNILRHPWGGTFHYMSTRNNDFTNRSQKATIVVKGWKLALIIGLSLAVLVIFIAWAVYMHKRLMRDPEHRWHGSRRGQWVMRLGNKLHQLYFRSWLHSAPWTVILFLLCLAFYAIGYWHAIWPKQLDPAPFYPHAKGCGRVLDVTCNLIFLPVLRNLISWLRTTPLRSVLPLGDQIYFHKLIGLAVAVPALGHILFHYLDYAWHSRLGLGVTFTEQAFGTWTGLTGHLILLCMLLIMSTALERVRRRRFTTKRFGSFSGHSLFVRMHKLWIVVLILLWSHSKAFWHYSLFPTLFVILDKLIARLRGKEPVELLEATMPARDVLALKLRLFSKRRLRFQAGQYCFLQCPQVSTEWHPFTISSSPEEPHFGVHIRCRRDMDWTYALRKLLMPDEKAGKAAISLVAKPPPERAAAAAKKKDGDSVQHKRAGSEKGWLSWLGVGPDSAVPEDQGEATPLQVRMSKEAKLERSAKDLASTSTGTHEKKQRSHKHGHEDDRANARDFLSARLRFLRRHKTKSMPKAEKMPEPNACLSEATPSPPPSPPEAPAVVMEIGGKAVELFVDGPYGSPSEDVFNFEVMILVGAGIGVTPFASILRTLAIQMQQNRLSVPLSRVEFYWICRDEAEFESFRDILVGIVGDWKLAQIFSINTYITGELNLNNYATKDRFNQFAGKPDWKRIAKEVRKNHPDTDVGVFLCGPNAIGDQLVAMCDSMNPKRDANGRLPSRALGGGPRFIFHKETF